VGEVDELQDAVDHRVAEGDQRVQEPDRQPRDDQERPVARRRDALAARDPPPEQEGDDGGGDRPPERQAAGPARGPVLLGGFRLRRGCAHRSIAIVGMDAPRRARILSSKVVRKEQGAGPARARPRSFLIRRRDYARTSVEGPTRFQALPSFS
jgi:hypothetical protein